MRPSRSITGLMAGLVGVAPACVVLAAAAPAVAADPASALGNVVINEFSTNGYAGGDFIELHNRGTTNVDLTGYHLTDDSGLGPTADVVLDGVIAAGGYAVVFPGDASYGEAGFGLGSSDEVHLLSPDTLTVIDEYVDLPEGTHASPSYARTTDGTGPFALAAAATPGGSNALSAGDAGISINEYSSEPTDFIEIRNNGLAQVDLTGWELADGATLAVNDEIVLGGESAILDPGEILSIATQGTPPTGVTFVAGGFGLSMADHVWLSNDEGALVDTTWVGLGADGVTTRHAQPSWARTAVGVGLWKMSAVATPGDVNDFDGGSIEVLPLDPNWDDIEINEIASLNDDDEGNPGFGDAIELANTGDTPVSIEGWYQRDSGAPASASKIELADLMVWDGSVLVPATDHMIAPGGYVAFSSVGGGLSGEGDAVKIYGPSATPGTGQLVDEQAYGNGDAGVSDDYESDSVAFAACPDGSDQFWRVTENSFGRDNTDSCATKSRRLDSPVVLNEVSNTSGEVELLNTGPDAVDISGWELLDSTGTVVHTVPAATTLAAGAFYTATGVTGLDSADALTIRRSTDGASVVAFTWYEDGIASYSRCELFGDISYVETPSATFGAANTCPSLDTQPWPGSAEITTVDTANGFGDGDGNGEGDVSGAAFDPADPSILWVVQNKNTLHKMHKVEGTYVAVDGWDGGKKIHFADGTGAVDSEGVTVGTDGSIYVTSERDNSNSSVSYNKILRYDVSDVTAETTDLTAVDEWDVNGFVVTGTNLGLEGITFVPDAHLVDAGWEVGGAPYTAASYPTPGLFVTAVEGTGNLHFFSLTDGAAPVEVKVEDSGFPFAMDVTYDADRDRLWALCDDSCGGVHNVLDVVDGDLVVEASYARPAGMPNLNNEGMAIAPASTCADGTQEVVWTDDGDTDGFSLRAGDLPCPVAIGNTALPTVSGTAKVGFTLSGSAGTWSPAPSATAYQWLANGAVIPAATTRTLKVGPTLVGKRISLRVRVTGEGVLAASATSAQTAPVVRGLIRAGNPTILGVPKAGRSVTVRTATATPAAAVSLQWFANGRLLRGQDRTALRLNRALVGKRITVRVTYAKAGHTSLVRTSKALRVRR